MDRNVQRRATQQGDGRARTVSRVWDVVVRVTPLLIAALALLAQIGAWPFNDYVRKVPMRIDLASSVFDAPGYDDPAREYVCLVNTSGGSVDLTGWELRDAQGVVNVLPAFTLPAGAGVRVHPGVGHDTKTDLFGTHESPAWTNSGDAVTLVNADGEQVDSRFYGAQQEGRGKRVCG